MEKIPIFIYEKSNPYEDFHCLLKDYINVYGYVFMFMFNDNSEDEILKFREKGFLNVQNFIERYEEKLGYKLELDKFKKTDLEIIEMLEILSKMTNVVLAEKPIKKRKFLKLAIKSAEICGSLHMRETFENQLNSL
jgi:hypothetical protein